MQYIMVALRMLVLQVQKKMMMLFVYLRCVYVCGRELFIQKSNWTSFYNGGRDGMTSNVLS